MGFILAVTPQTKFSFCNIASGYLGSMPKTPALFVYVEKLVAGSPKKVRNWKLQDRPFVFGNDLVLFVFFLTRTCA